MMRCTWSCPEDETARCACDGPPEEVFARWAAERDEQDGDD
jgi:hypothetical protein